METDVATLLKERPELSVPAYVERASPEIVATDADRRTMRFVASREVEDRTGDIIRAGGWELESFRRNPILLWAHKSREPAIGNVTDIGVEGDALMADVEFAQDQHLTEEARCVVGLTLAGVIRAVSVGMNPLEYAYRIENDNFVGVDYIRHELVELSVVNVPAHQDALAVGRDLGFSDTTVSKLFAASPQGQAGASAGAELELRRYELDLLKLGDTGCTTSQTR